MPELDRRISVTYTTTTVGRDGSAETTTATLGMWARKIQDNVTRTLEAQGAYGTAARSYRVRYNPALVAAIEAGETVQVIEQGYEQTIEAVGEPERAGRLRFLDLIVRE